MAKENNRWPVVLKGVQVNIPFAMLVASYLELFVSRGINPEIGLDANALDGFDRATFETVAASLQRAGLSVTFHGPFIDLSPGSSDPQIRAVTRRRFEQVLRLMPLFRPKSLVCHAGYARDRYGFFRETWLENSLDTWRWLAPRVVAEGGRLMLENVYEHQPLDIRVLYEQLAGDRVGFCLDTGHQSAFSQASMSEWVAVLGPYIAQLHLHDNHGKSDEHLALGHGIIEYEPLFSYLKQHHSKPPIITLEPHEEKELWPSLDYLETHWPWK